MIINPEYNALIYCIIATCSLSRFHLKKFDFFTQNVLQVNIDSSDKSFCYGNVIK